MRNAKVTELLKLAMTTEEARAQAKTDVATAVKSEKKHGPARRPDVFNASMNARAGLTNMRGLNRDVTLAAKGSKAASARMPARALGAAGGMAKSQRETSTKKRFLARNQPGQ